MTATTDSSIAIEDAIVRVGERLGMKTLILRLLAAELPDNPWLLDLDVRTQGEVTVARTTHLCGSTCEGDVLGCLTAFKVENAVTKASGREMGITGLTIGPSGDLRVELSPISVEEVPLVTERAPRAG